MSYFFKPASIALALSLGMASCTGGQIDPQKVIDTARTVCGIVIAFDSVIAIINAGVGLTVDAIVQAVCSAFKAQLAAEKLQALPPGTKVKVPVVINGKTIDVFVTVK